MNGQFLLPVLHLVKMEGMGTGLVTRWVLWGISRRSRGPNRGGREVYAVAAPSSTENGQADV